MGDVSVVGHQSEHLCFTLLIQVLRKFLQPSPTPLIELVAAPALASKLLLTSQEAFRQADELVVPFAAGYQSIHNLVNSMGLAAAPARLCRCGYWGTQTCRSSGRLIMRSCWLVLWFSCNLRSIMSGSSAGVQGRCKCTGHSATELKKKYQDSKHCQT